ncbi:MAG: lipase family protein, partial [Micrococcales bacterium]
SLVVTAEVLAAQLVIDAIQASPIKLAHLAIRLPTVITRLRRLIVACEAMLDRISTTENRLLAGMALDIGITTGLVINPPVRVSAGQLLGKTSAPASLATLAERMMYLDNRGTPTIRIEKYANAAIVYLPGTRTGSFGWNANPMDMKTNLQEMSGRVSNVEVGLEKALAAAGVKPSDRIMLVGHSQGGLVAISAAERAKSGDFPYFVQKVVTFGSPVGAKYADLLPNVLSVENKFDLVPKLDLKGNPESPNWLTLEGKVEGDPITAHRMESYLQISTEIDQSGKASAFVNFAEGPASVTNYELSQGPDLRC